MPAVSVLMAQLLVIAPIYLTVFSFLSRHRAETKEPLWTTVLKAVANPVSIAAVVGAAVSLTSWTPPEVIWQPLDMLTKLALMPTAAWLLGHFVFGLSGLELFGVVAMAALPTAQNVFLFASQFRLPTLLVRDTIFASSFLSRPVILLITLLLAPA
ncbi:hypothetical protein [Citricoccus muralis]|uniref:AEC family transporter n=1 Tax=Citricoccus muralis TaxID=169134 RepID=A0ABY8H563_9MICC|nr:hypothetical protein [Citricoccus muralis]WFP15793.1 hypothetical protein P8192_10335 [Citricoccus muralis]